MNIMRFFPKYLEHAKIMAMEFRSRAVAIATRMSIPKAIKVGIRIIAAPSPAIVRRVVNTKFNVPAIIAMSIIGMSSLCLDDIS